MATKAHTYHFGQRMLNSWRATGLNTILISVRGPLAR